MKEKKEFESYKDSINRNALRIQFASMLKDARKYLAIDSPSTNLSGNDGEMNQFHLLMKDCLRDIDVKQEERLAIKKSKALFEAKSDTLEKKFFTTYKEVKYNNNNILFILQADTDNNNTSNEIIYADEEEIITNNNNTSISTQCQKNKKIKHSPAQDDQFNLLFKKYLDSDVEIKKSEISLKSKELEIREMEANNRKQELELQLLKYKKDNNNEL